jgi:hypothetical protein
MDYSLDDEVSVAATILVRTASIDRTEREVGERFKLTYEDAQDAVAEASMLLIASAPKELSNSFMAVCSYHRWNHIYETAFNASDMDTAMDAQKQLDKLLRSVH